LHALGAPPALILSQDQTLHQDDALRRLVSVAVGSPLAASPACGRGSGSARHYGRPPLSRSCARPVFGAPVVPCPLPSVRKAPARTRAPAFQRARGSRVKTTAPLGGAANRAPPDLSDPGFGSESRQAPTPRSPLAHPPRRCRRGLPCHRQHRVGYYAAVLVSTSLDGSLAAALAAPPRPSWLRSTRMISSRRQRVKGIRQAISQPIFAVQAAAKSPLRRGAVNRTQRRRPSAVSVTPGFVAGKRSSWPAASRERERHGSQLAAPLPRPHAGPRSATRTRTPPASPARRGRAGRR
jgi:hypothetical protein